MRGSAGASLPPATAWGSAADCSKDDGAQANDATTKHAASPIRNMGPEESIGEAIRKTTPRIENAFPARFRSIDELTSVLFEPYQNPQVA